MGVPGADLGLRPEDPTLAELLKLFPWVILAGFVGNFIQNQVYFILGRRYGTRTVEKHPDWKSRLQQVHRWAERFRSALIIGVRFVPGFRTIGGVAIGMSDVSLGMAPGQYIIIISTYVLSKPNMV